MGKWDQNDKEVLGEEPKQEPMVKGPHPFTVILDSGLKRTSTGSRIFATLKGALDGGINIPHNEKRFVGYDNNTGVYDPEIMKKYILGGHVSDFMEELREEEPDGFRLQFSQYIKYNVKADDLEELYQKVHRKIREAPYIRGEQKRRDITSETK